MSNQREAVIIPDDDSEELRNSHGEWQGLVMQQGLVTGQSWRSWPACIKVARLFNMVI